MALNKAQLMDVPGGPGVTGSVKAGTGITIAVDGAVSLTPIGGTLTPGSYTSTNLTVDAYGRITAAANGGGGGGGDIPAGSVMIFANATAPTGWTKSSSYDNTAIRLVSGSGGVTGGSVAFTSAFTNQPVTGTVTIAGMSISGGSTDTVSQTPSGSVSLSGLSVGSTSLSEAQMPSHTHSYTYTLVHNQNINAQGNSQANDRTQTGTTAATGGNGGHSHSVSGSGSFSGNNMSHSHSVSGTVSGNANLSGNPINLAVRYVDFIVCTKN